MQNKKRKRVKKGPSIEIQEIIEKSKDINTDMVAKEMLSWLILNVENFIDNQKREFKIDLVLDSVRMPESMKLQELYQAIPEEDDDLVGLKEIGNIKDIKASRFTEVNKCRKALDKVTKKCHKDMKENKQLLDVLFKRMIYYYEMVGFNRGTVLCKELKGAVTITQFDYEAFSINVQMTPVKVGVTNAEGKMNSIEVSEEKNYDIPEGFAIWLEIAYKDTIQRPTLF